MTLWQFDAECVDVESQHGVATHQGGQFRGAVDAEMAHHRVERFLADAAGAEELASEIDDRLLVIGRIGQFLAIAESIYQLVAQSLLPSGRRVSVPNELTVVLHCAKP